ncbi:MAG: TolC family protein [Bacteroidia bacterium]|nr:TolC family protein [Bacteroidia bacterium]
MKNRTRMTRILKERRFSRIFLIRIIKRWNIRVQLEYALTLVLFLFLLSSACKGQTLEEYIAKGLKNSPFLKDYSIQIQANLIDSLKVLAGFKPQVGLSADLMYPPAIGKFAYDSAITDGGHYSALVRIDQPLFFGKKSKIHLQSVLIQKLITENNWKITESDLKASITDQYIITYADYNQVQFERKVLQMLKDQQMVLKLLVERGLYQQTDYLNLTVNINSRSISGKQTHRQFKNDLAILNLLCGIHDTAAVELSKPDLFVWNTFDISSSPNMVRFRIDSLNNVNEHLLIELGYKPHVGLFADAGINAISPRRMPYSLGTSFGLSFAMPLYDGKQRQLEHKRVLLFENSRSQYRSFFENRYRQQRDQLLEQMVLTDDVISDMKNQLANIDKLITLYKIEINEGMVRWLDFLAVINNYAQALNDLTQSEINRLQIINKLNYLK